MGVMGGLTERQMFDGIGQNSDAASCSASSSIIAVCVKKKSGHAVKWALDNLVFEGDQLTLIHVRRPIVAVPTPMGNHMPISQVCSDVLAAHVQTVASQTLGLLRHFQQMCNNKKVQPEIIVLEDNNITKAILKYISNSRISKLVMGSPHHLITRNLKGRGLPATIAMKTPKFCSLYVISKGKLTSVHAKKTSAQDSSSYSSEKTLLLRGKRVLEPSEITTVDDNGNQIIGNNRRDFNEPLISKVGKTSFFSGSLPDNETELERLMTEFQQTRETCSGAIAFEEAIAVNDKAEGLNIQLIEELLKLEETKDAFESADQRCRRYSIEQIESATDFFSESLKIGEGGYGPVYKGRLDHTTVAIKVLRTDAAQGRDAFQREIELLSHIHHPNMILLLGTCTEHGCLVYEYMENGSLENQLFHRRASLPWYIRFRIASEIASALHFLHTAKPNPIVHRDLKPANILLDHNFVSKIGDVGLAKLISPTVSSTVTEYKNTLLAGTLQYMDPEYIRTGTLRPSSDLYALGIILLELLTAKRPVAAMEQVQTAVREGSFKDILDKTAGEWPLEETIEFAKLALKCTELLRRDRPDMETVVLPELERFRDLADAHAKHCTS